MADTSQYKVGKVLSVDTKSAKGGGGKPLRACSVDIGDEGNPITVVTSASNVREGSRIVVAPIGSFIINDEGEEITVKKTTVGGVVSEGIFCDAKMLGWAGGAQGIAAQVPDSFELGSAPPPTKPGSPSGNTNGDGNNAGESAAVEVKGLFEKKLTKEEKKKLAEEKRKARKAAKEAKSKNDGDCAQDGEES
mmetsp:Transcript_6874/g.13750  ORF Transcript_6874/g.13750 Transcript_6874/m.13750 type:complete len:192 (-) Transcript_6874:101-676(-)